MFAFNIYILYVCVCMYIKRKKGAQAFIRFEILLLEKERERRGIGKEKRVNYKFNHDDIEECVSVLAA